MNRTLSILLVEDNEVDVIAFERMLEKHPSDVSLTVAQNGKEALNCLADGTLVTRPRMIFLDLNLPLMSGHEFLTEIRSSPTLSSEVVFVLTTSDDPMDIHRAYRNQVAGYFVKSNGKEHEATLAGVISLYLQSVILPDASPSIG